MGIATEKRSMLDIMLHCKIAQSLFIPHGLSDAFWIGVRVSCHGRQLPWHQLRRLHRKVAYNAVRRLWLSNGCRVFKSAIRYLRPCLWKRGFRGTTSILSAPSRYEAVKASLLSLSTSPSISELAASLSQITFHNVLRLLAHLVSLHGCARSYHISYRTDIRVATMTLSVKANDASRLLTLCLERVAKVTIAFTCAFHTRLYMSHPIKQQRPRPPCLLHPYREHANSSGNTVFTWNLLHTAPALLPTQHACRVRMRRRTAITTHRSRLPGMIRRGSLIQHVAALMPHHTN
jgi:hypothetical protein